MVDVRFSRPAMWLTTVTFTLAAGGGAAPSLRIQVPVPSTAAEAPTGFDNRSNGTVDDSTHQADQDAFDEVEEIADGLGPLYNAQACRECHQNPTSGAASQITELRVGHLGPDGRFQDRKSTRLNSSHRCTSYAVFCVKKKSTQKTPVPHTNQKTTRLHYSHRPH